MKSDLAARGAEQHPDRTALCFDGRGYSDHQLNELAVRFASRLAGLGVGAGDRVAILAANHPAHFELLLAAPKLGFMFAPLNVRLSAPELRQALRQVQSSLLFHDARHASLAEQCFAGLRVQLNTADEDQAMDEGLAPPAPALSPDSIQKILMIGGSTGTPKAAMLPYRQILSNAQATAEHWKIGSEDCAIQATPCYHAALNVLSTPLLAVGGRVVLMSAFDPGNYLRLVEEHRASLMFMVPSMYRQLAEHPAFASTDLSSVRWAICGGAPCPESLAEMFHHRGIAFRQGYGMTEAGVNCFTQSVEEGNRDPDGVGRPMRHVQMQIRHPDGRACAAGEIGELTLAGAGLCAGYYGAEAEGRAAMRDGWFWTDDLAGCDTQGRYRIRGRRKDIFISGGENVLECVVIAVSDARWGEVGLAAVVMRAGAMQDAALLKQALRQRLAGYKLPRDVFFCARYRAMVSASWIVVRMNMPCSGFVFGVSRSNHEQEFLRGSECLQTPVDKLGAKAGRCRPIDRGGDRVNLLCAGPLGIAAVLIAAPVQALEFTPYRPLYPAMYVDATLTHDPRDQSFDAAGRRRSSALPNEPGRSRFPEQRLDARRGWTFPLFERDALPFLSDRLHLARLTLRYQRAASRGDIERFIDSRSDLQLAGGGLGDTTLEFGSFLSGSRHWREGRVGRVSSLLLFALDLPTGIVDRGAPENADSNHRSSQIKVGVHGMPWDGAWLDAGLGYRQHAGNDEPAFGGLVPAQRGREWLWDVQYAQRLRGGLHLALALSGNEGKPNRYDAPRLFTGPQDATPLTDTAPAPGGYVDRGIEAYAATLALRGFAHPRLALALSSTHPFAGRSGEFDLDLIERLPAGCSPGALGCLSLPAGSTREDGLGEARSYASDRIGLSLTWQVGSSPR
ncbi:MAG: AMP-binding protein [Panacagrimonas sp.]